MEVEGTVELPAEANPLTEGILYHVLRSASSSDPHQIQTGTKQLQKWETETGFYSLLQSVFLDKSLPLEVRYLSIIQLKNGIDKYWRRTALNAVSKNDKALIRSRLFESGINEANQRLALQNALVIAKIIRFEYPNDWPEAISQLIGIIRQSILPGASPLHLPRALLILLHIIKELATGRLMRTRTSLQSISPEIFHVLGRIYLDKVHKWHSFLTNGGDDEGGALDDIEQSLLTIKIIRRLVIAGYEFPNRDKDIHQFWAIVRNQLGDFLALALPKEPPLESDVRQYIEKHLMQLSKFHLEMAKSHPAAFILLPDSINLVQAYWGLIAKLGENFGSEIPDSSKIGTDGDTSDDEKSILERLSLKGLLLIRSCVKMVFSPARTFKYRHPQEKEEKTQATEAIKTNLLTDNFVREMMELIVTRFFVFRQSDLRQWEEDPDEWERREEGAEDSYEFTIRPCSEKLFLDLATNYKDLIVQPLLSVFYSVATPENENILFKDSVYSAIGLAAPVVYPHLDFDSFITSTLVQEIQKQKPGYNLIRRRIAILLGQWISIKVSKQSRPIVYEIFQHLLDKNDPLNDHVVRVTAGRQFKNIADEWEFVAQDFLPFAPKILARLMSLVEEAELSETKMALLNTLSVIVLRMEHNITPYANQIVALLPPLWDQSGGEHLMKQAILTILARLINAMKSESIHFHSLVLPIIKTTIEPDSETQVYLLDDAMDLWASILIQNPSPASPDLLSLASYLFPLFTLGTDTLRKSLEITESYVLLAPQHMLADNLRAELLISLTTLLGTLRPDASGIVTHLVEVVVRAAYGLGGEEAVQVLVGNMIQTGFLGKLLAGLQEAWEAHQTTGPRAREPTVDGVVETDYFSVLARICVASPRIFIEGIAAAAPNPGTDNTVESVLNQTMPWLLEEWFSHFENIGDPTKRKLMCLAFTRLTETNASWILGKLQDLLTVWTDIAVELTDGMGDKNADSLVYEPPTPEQLPSDPEAPEDIRRRELTYSDPVHRINMITFIRDHLTASIQNVGGEQVFREEWLSRVDADILKAFGANVGMS